MPSKREKAFEQALALLEGLHPCITVDDDDIEGRALAVFDHVQGTIRDLEREVRETGDLLRMCYDDIRKLQRKA